MRFFNFVAISGIVIFSGCGGSRSSRRSDGGPLLEHGSLQPDERLNGVGNRGQVNLGNTCYFNALMQVLAHADPVKEYVEKTEVAQDKPVTSGFKNLVMAIWAEGHGGQVYDPKKFLQLCRKNAPGSFGKRSQEDAYEAYGAVLNMFDDENLKGLYYFQVASRLHCPTHGIDVKPKMEPHSGLTLSFTKTEDDVDVTDLLRSWGTPERVEAKCGKETNDPVASKSSFLMTVPEVLVVQLGRFAFNRGLVRKINTGVRFDIDLDLGEIMKDRIDPTLASQGSLKYKLTGVVYHHGEGLKSGHYTADYHNSFSNRWFHADDMRITRTDTPGKQNSSSAYILIYSKVE